MMTSTSILNDLIPNCPMFRVDIDLPSRAASLDLGPHNSPIINEFKGTSVCDPANLDQNTVPTATDSSDVMTLSP